LGNEFEPFAIDERNLRLDPTLLTINEEDLISHLRSIQSNHAANSAPTVSSHGYANALKASNASTKSGQAAISNDQMTSVCHELKDSYESFIKQQAEAFKEYAQAIRSEPSSRSDRNRKPPTAYCFTHGDCHHTGAECNKPRHSPDKNAATLEDRMGGSKKGMKKE